VVKNRRFRNRGAAITELAIAFPVLFFPALFCIQAAQAFHLHAIADQAAWRALHHAATERFSPEDYEPWKETIRQEAVQELAQLAEFEEENLVVEVEMEEIDDERREITLHLVLTIASPMQLVSGDLQFERNLKIRQYR